MSKVTVTKDQNPELYGLLHRKIAENDSAPHNFIWCLNKYLHDGGVGECIREGWNDKTLREYLLDYENIIIPAMKETEFGLSDLGMMSQDDLEEVLYVIGRNRENEGEEPYVETTMDHFRRIIWLVYKAGFINKHYEDRLGFERSGLYGNEKTAISRARFNILRKSLTMEEEKRVAEWFMENLDPATSPGELYGILLMFTLGLRNSESCGIVFKNISKFQRRSYSCAFITTSLDSDTGKRKVGGKTDNMPRIIPVYDFLRDIIQARKEAIIRYLSDSGVQSPEIVVENYPITCKGLDFSRNAVSKDLTETGGSLLRELLEGNYDLRSELVSQELFRERLKSEMVDEKDSTTYLFRRNFASGLFGLGFDNNQIHYLMGHVIDDYSDRREYYSNADRQDDLRAVFDKHPLRVFFKEGVPQLSVRIDSRKEKKDVLIEVYSKEPAVEIDFRSCGEHSGSVMATVSKGFIPEYSDSVDIRTKLVEVAESTMKDSSNP